MVVASGGLAGVGQRAPAERAALAERAPDLGDQSGRMSSLLGTIRIELVTANFPEAR